MNRKKSVGGVSVKYFSIVSCALVVATMPVPASARLLLPGEVATINAGATPEQWTVPATATLNINGASALDIRLAGGTLNASTAVTSHISASANSLVNLSNSTLTGTTFESALGLLDSNATVSTSTLSSQNTALILARDLLRPVGSVATVIGSTVSGGLSGAAVTTFSTLNLATTLVEGTGASGIGLELAGGNANVTAGSRIMGEVNGVVFVDDIFANPNDVTGQSHLIVDGSTVQSRTGAAISVDYATPVGQPVLIDVTNGANLVGGNQNLLEVMDGAAARFRVDASHLVGNVDVAPGGSASVVLQNSASLAGNFNNVDSVVLDTQSVLTGNITGSGAGAVTLDNGAVFQGAVVGIQDMSISRAAQWNMVGNNSVSRLQLQGGSVRLGSDQAFSRLDVANLSGNGQFLMNSDVATRQTDFLNVTESATGQHELLIAATASEAPSGAPVKVGNIAAGDAVFSLRNGEVDVGALSYKLVKEGEGLFLQPDAASPSSGTKTALAIAGTAPTVIYSEMTTLNTRLGDRRMAGTQPQARSAATSTSSGEAPGYGIWMRTYANQYSIDDAYGDGYKQHQTGVSIGVDAPLPFGDGQWLIGGFGGYSSTKLNLARGSSGSIESVYLGSYLTWFDEESGYYVDTVAKINRFDNNVKVALSDDTRTKGDFSNYGVSASVEVGKHIVMDNGFFIEPSAQVGMAAVEGKDYSLDNGLRVNSDETRSLLAKAGLAVGREIVLDNGGRIQPRLRIATSHEFVKNNQVGVNDTDFNNDLSSTSVEVTAGLNWIPAKKKWQLYAELGAGRGSKVDQEVGGSVGLSYNF